MLRKNIVYHLLLIFHLLFSVFCFLFSVSSILSCTNHNKIPPGTSVFRYNESSGITSLDPAFAKDQANIWAVNQLFSGLLQLNDQLEVKPCIAHRWEISGDGRTYTFHLRGDVSFHNHPIFKEGKGRRVVAGDFVYSFNRITDPTVASPGAWVFNNVEEKNGKYAFEAPDDTTLVIRLKSPFPPFPGLLTMQYCSVVPREAVEHYGRDFRKNPIGTGPFYMKMWKEGVKLVLLKNNAYFEIEGNERLPYLDAVVVSFIADKQSVFMEFIKGNIDFMSGLDPNYKDELITRHGLLNPKYKDKITLTKQPYLNTEYLGFLMGTYKTNNNNPLADKRVRQAVNYGFDRVKMIKYLRNNIGTPGLSGMVPKGLPSFSPELKGYDYNPQKAKMLLSEAGYPEGKGLIPITLMTTSSYLDICKFIQQQLTEIGIELKIEVTPAASLREMIAQGKVTFFRGSWIGDYPDAENYLSLFTTRNFCPKGPNYTHFSSTEYDRLYDKSLTAVKDSMRYKMYRQMDSIMIDEAPVVVLFYDEVLRFTRKNITGLGSNAMNLLTLKKVRKY